MKSAPFTPLVAAGLLIVAAGSPADEPAKPVAAPPSAVAPLTAEEARGRARLLNETIHGALQVMHRDFFGADEDLNLPSQSLKDVFKELERQFQVKVSWLGVNATKSADHEPKDEFERQAARALLKGDAEYAAVEGDQYRHVGAIKIQNECLKCHVPFRTTLEDRVAGLAISIPLRPAAP